jgi:hypothetical protein
MHAQLNKRGHENSNVVDTVTNGNVDKAGSFMKLFAVANVILSNMITQIWYKDEAR